MPELIGMSGLSWMTGRDPIRSRFEPAVLRSVWLSGAMFDAAPFSPVCCRRSLALTTKPPPRCYFWRMCCRVSSATQLPVPVFDRIDHHVMLPPGLLNACARSPLRDRGGRGPLADLRYKVDQLNIATKHQQLTMEGKIGLIEFQHRSVQRRLVEMLRKLAKGADIICRCIFHDRPGNRGFEE